MAITRIKNSGIKTGVLKYDSSLGGLPGVMPAPTAADAGTGSSATVTFSAISGATSYTALSTPGSFTGTSASSPITVSGLTTGTAYTFQVRATNSTGTGAYSAASNSVTPAAPGAFESIASTTGTGSSATITFSSIPSTFEHLQIRFMIRESGSGGGGSLNDIRIRINGDTGANYAYHQIYGGGSTVSAVGSANGTYMEYYGIYPLNGTTANVMGVGILDIQDYKNTTRNKTIRMIAGCDNNGAGYINLGSGLRFQTNAVTSVSIIAVGTNFSTTSTFALYGIKGS